RASGNLFVSQQAKQYALGGEALGIAVLPRDIKVQGNAPQRSVDHPLEEWAKPLPAFPIDNGQISVRIEDMTGRFNLNSLVQDDKVNTLAEERFCRLLLR